jgi:aryl-alcohol dehydrogenase-like predicted oxidoreductase
MNSRRLGNTDLHLTEIGFGAWAIGGGGYAFGWGAQDDAESIAAIRRALELGVNWIDTAAVYGLGRSEEIVAKALQGRRESVIIATKCTRRWNGVGEIYGDMSAVGIKWECEQSLKRLKTDRIDLYQIHWPDPDEKTEEAWEAVNELIAEGKVRYGGVSNFTAAQLERAQKLHPIASLQPPYSIMRRKVEGEEFAFCRQHKIGVVAYSPMQSGLLTGKFHLDRVAQDDWRRRTSEFQEPNLPINLWFVDELRTIAANYGKTVAQLAVAWVLRDEVVTSAIVGARSHLQVEETVGGAGWKINAEDLERIDELLDERARRVTEAGGVVRR